MCFSHYAAAHTGPVSKDADSDVFIKLMKHQQDTSKQIYCWYTMSFFHLVYSCRCVLFVYICADQPLMNKDGNI